MVDLVLSIIAISLSVISFGLSVWSYFHNKNIRFAELTGFNQTAKDFFEYQSVNLQNNSLDKNKLPEFLSLLDKLKVSFLSNYKKNSRIGKLIQSLFHEYEDALCALLQWHDDSRAQKLENVVFKIRKYTKKLL